MIYAEFKKIVRQYCLTYEFPRASCKICRYLWNIYKQDINANCHQDISIDVAQFLDQRHTELESNMNNSLSTLDFYKAKEALQKANVPQPWSVSSTTGCFDLCITTAPVPCVSRVCKKEEENSMTTNTERTYLAGRLNEARYAKREDLTVKFHLHGTNQPKTYKELIDAIKNGAYTVDAKRQRLVDAYIENDEVYRVNGCFDGIVWTRAGAPDWDGYNAAEKALELAFKAAKDVVATTTAYDTVGLKALQDFEAWTI